MVACTWFRIPIFILTILAAICSGQLSLDEDPDETFQFLQNIARNVELLSIDEMKNKIWKLEQETASSLVTKTKPLLVGLPNVTHQCSLDTRRLLDDVLALKKYALQCKLT